MWHQIKLNHFMFTSKHNNNYHNSDQTQISNQSGVWHQEILD